MSVILSAAYWAPCTYVALGDDLKVVETKFRCRFRRLKTSERKEMERRLNQAAAVNRADAGLETGYKPEEIEQFRVDKINDQQLLDIFLVDWDFKGRNGEFLAYTEAERAVQVEENDGLEAAMIRAYFDSRNVLNSHKVTEKNSGAPSGTGS